MYGSLSDADSFFAANDLTGLWATYTNQQKTAALNRATFLIDNLAFEGQKLDFAQENEFPRMFWNGTILLYFDLDASGSIIVPKKVKHAAYLQAKLMLDNLDSPQISALLQGITSQSIGSTSESYDTSLLPIDTKTLLFRQVADLLQPYLVGGW